MSVGWRSTSINLAAKHCARALDHLERGDPYPRDVFGVGKTAHACLEDLGKAYQAEGFELAAEEGGAERVMRATCERLIREGRDFEGDREPPLPAEVVWAGRDLALRFERSSGYGFSGGEYELGLAVNRHWQLCPYGPGAYFRARIDRMHGEEPGLMDDFDSGRVLVVTDYKGWQGGEGPIPLQQRGQAVLGWLAWGADYESLRIDVVNYQLGRTSSYPIHPNEPEGAALLARWRADIDSTVESLDAMKGEDGWRPASPGVRCMGCPYLGICKPAQEAASAVYGSADPVELARSYAAHLAFADAFEPLVREATAEAPIELDGALIGTLPKVQKTLTEAAPGVLAAAWNRKTHPDTVEASRALVEGFIIRCGLPRASAEKLLKHLYSGGPEEIAKRDKLMASITTTKTVRSFGVHRKEDGNGS